MTSPRRGCYIEPRHPTAFILQTSLEKAETDNAASMRLYLAVAVLMMLVVAAQAETQMPPAFQKIADFHQKVVEFGSDLSDKASAAFKKLEESEFVTKTKSWFTEQMSKLKDAFSK
ncbi:apolipoprotein C-I-like [Colossoma macropomum]|uniref:apolipoprotein C-I-like n=1 Tax=Colossoma macropomum TaxID=42526 RepID=UPI0018644CB6|nr:apolipoprotein C-I-like [Colossoma macropomum]